MHIGVWKQLSDCVFFPGRVGSPSYILWVYAMHEYWHSDTKNRNKETNKQKDS